MDAKNWGERVIGTCQLPSPRLTVRWLDGTRAWGPTLVVAPKGQTKTEAQLESSTRLMMDSGRTTVRCSLKHA